MNDIDQMNEGPRWYIAHTYSGYEDKVKSSIERIVENRGLGHLIFDVQVPIEISHTVNEKGVEKEVKTKIYPSYVVVKMAMTSESWHVVRNITGVTGFVGPGSVPQKLTDEEVESLRLENHEVGVRDDEPAFAIGDYVTIVSGMFEGYSGKIQEISADSKDVTILASTGKRDIPIMAKLKEIKKVD